MVERLIESPEIDVIAAYQEHRQEKLIISGLKKAFYRIFAKSSNADVIVGASDFRVFRSEVGEAILNMPEYHRFSKGIFAWVGFNVEAVPYEAQARHSGSTKWPLTKLFSYALSGIISFTSKPLAMIAIFGVAVSAIALIYALMLIVQTLLVGVEVPGYASLLAVVLLLGGAQLLALGLIGIYLARTYDQNKNRPHYIVRRHFGGDSQVPVKQGRDQQ